MTLDHEANQAIRKQLRIMGYHEDTVEWDGALAAARAFVDRKLAERIPIPERTVEQGRPIEDLGESGLLWLINRVVFHPRGFRLALMFTQGRFGGWILEGDGSEPHWLTEDADRDRFYRAEATLQAARHAAECDVCGPPPASDGATA